jgi:O-6-methylguanine DNA methyltransferase
VQVPVGFTVVAQETPFDRRVAEMIRRIPPGRVASYGSVAEWIGAPAAARAVGRSLSREIDVPWHRVVTASGRLVPKSERTHRELLRAEGVRVRGNMIVAPIPWWEGPDANP